MLTREIAISHPVAASPALGGTDTTEADLPPPEANGGQTGEAL